MVHDVKLSRDNCPIITHSEKVHMNQYPFCSAISSLMIALLVDMSYTVNQITTYIVYR